MRHNRLRELIDSGQPSLGTRILSSWPTTVELIGHSGMFDYVEFVSEYAPYDLYTLENLGRTVELFGDMGAMIKIEQEPRSHLAGRAIAAGFQSVLFADVRSVEDAKQCVGATRHERPQSGGHMGVAVTRAGGVLLESGSAAYADAMDDIVVVLMIEKKSAVEDLESILKVPGVDMIQFGPSDYSTNLGYSGQPSHPEVKEAEQYALETAAKLGVAARVELTEPEGFEPYLELGIRHFNVGVDVVTLFKWLKKAGTTMREALGVEPVAVAGAENKQGYTGYSR